ncbi:hypothetical protein [Rhizobium leguminosarum]|uniref:hypothetical protein n=1 Tax=Rhizobium leguminosarum TaxID=384 RepID=UPI001FF03B67|nr:hypothetical protein [Rhizobium leguminosarum]
MSLASGVADVISIRVESHMVEGEPVQDGGRLHYKIRKRNQALPTEKVLPANIRIMLGGTAAEEVIFGNRSIGAGGVEGSDLEQTTRLAYRLVGSYGLGKWAPLPGRINPRRRILRADARNSCRSQRNPCARYRATKDLLTKETARLVRLTPDYFQRTNGAASDDMRGK